MQIMWLAIRCDTVLREVGSHSAGMHDAEIHNAGSWDSVRQCKVIDEHTRSSPARSMCSNDIYGRSQTMSRQTQTGQELLKWHRRSTPFNLQRPALSKLPFALYFSRLLSTCDLAMVSYISMATGNRSSSALYWAIFRRHLLASDVEFSTSKSSAAWVQAD